MAEYVHPIACVGAVAAAGTAIFTSPGGATPAKTKKGQYTLTFAAADGFDGTQKSLFISVRGTPLEVSVTHTSDVVKTIDFLDNAAAAQDSDFDYMVVSGPQA